MSIIVLEIVDLTMDEGDDVSVKSKSESENESEEEEDEYCIYKVRCLPSRAEFAGPNPDVDNWSVFVPDNEFFRTLDYTIPRTLAEVRALLAFYHYND
jgi:hypothetical protein